MKLGFEESQAPYVSGSQLARVWTERWVADWAYCPNCGGQRISQFPANRPVADFHCTNCAEEYELKSQRKPLGRKVMDGAFSTKLERLAAQTNPNLLLLRYDRPSRAVIDLCVVPKHFFVLDIIEQRKPLAPTARRAGWIGSNILLDRLPPSAKIFLVRDSAPQPKESVLRTWKRTAFLQDRSEQARGWLIEVMKCVELLGKSSFTLDEAYSFESQLGSLYPDNRHVKPKIRQQLQVLRDNGYLEFAGRGRYRLLR